MRVPRTNLYIAAIVIAAAVAGTLYYGAKRNVGTGPYAAEVADAIPLIEKETGLTFKTQPKVEERSKQEVSDFLLTKFNEESPSEELAGEEAAYKLFGMLPDTLNLRKFLLSVLTEQVIGYYDPAAKTLYVVKGADEKVVNITITHELVHALQDQYVNLDSIQKSTSDNDRLTAAQAVIEGQAQYEQISIMLGGGNIALKVGGRDRIREMIRENMSAMPVFATAPMVIQESLLFPYLSGADFVQRFKEKKGKTSPFTNIPRSTEQIFHSDAFFSDTPDEPTTITLPEPRGAKKVYSNNMGEFGARIFLYQYLKDEQTAARAAAGWDGDRYVVLQSGAGKGIVWATVWDSTLEAAEFTDALTRATSKRTAMVERAEAAGGATFHPKGRTVSIAPRIIAGRALVIYSDLPDGMSGVIDPAAIKLDQH
ncbi:MAG: hypothetical protein JWM95_204 [Gemmatimonadetes bacterium]|nr:hypothetical protein [Gemmatimonadota bacterium]